MRGEREGRDVVRSIAFVVPGQPMSQPRARFARMGGHVRTYDPKEAVAYKDTVRGAFMGEQALSGWKRIEEGSISLEVIARFERPVSKCSKKVPRGAEWMAGGKDADNVAKIIMDALNHVAWKDDRLVAHLRVFKVMCAQGQAPSVTVTIEEITGGDPFAGCGHS